MEAIRQAFVAMTNPRRADAVAKTGELFMKSYNDKIMNRINRKMQTNKIGRQILLEKPLITNALLKTYPKDSFGESYMSFIDSHGFSLDRPIVSTKMQHPYILTRYRQIHDFNHVLFNLRPTVHGEAILKWIEFQQLELTMPLFAGLVGIYYNLTINDIQYGTQQGYVSDFMMNIYYEKHLETNLNELRSKLKITPFKYE